MIDTEPKEITGRDIPQLSELGNIEKDYRHHQRQVTPGVALSLADVYLKWYNMHRPEVEISEDLIQDSRNFLQAEVAAGLLKFENQLGFVVLHHCTSVAFLIVCTWHNINELWKTVYVKDLVNGGSYQLVDPRGYVPGFCVWEMAAVWHETQAWNRYLYSERDEPAKYAYLNDQIEGLI